MIVRCTQTCRNGRQKLKCHVRLKNFTCIYDANLKLKLTNPFVLHNTTAVLCGAKFKLPCNAAHTLANYCHSCTHLWCFFLLPSLTSVMLVLYIRMGNEVIYIVHPIQNLISPLQPRIRFTITSKMQLAFLVETCAFYHFQCGPISARHKNMLTEI
jgi:hypothetical protein